MSHPFGTISPTPLGRGPSPAPSPSSGADEAVSPAGSLGVPGSAARRSQTPDFSLNDVSRGGRKDGQELDRSTPPRTKIICTIGPASDSEAVLQGLFEAGMNVARLNFSHGSHESHLATIRRVRSVMKATKRIAGILLDTKGPEIRTGMLEGGKEVRLEKGQPFTLVTDDDAMLGNAQRVAVLYRNMPKVLSPGNEVLLDDGLVALRVESVGEAEIACTVLNGGALGQRKGVNLPGVAVDLPAVTQKDVADIAFGVEQGVDFIAASFVRTPEDVRTIRGLLGERGAHIRVIAKIENQQGVENFDGILAESDGIMVARGDLGVEIPIEQVALAQKMMIRKCNAAGKPVITATQMLESMVENPSPTRAEVSDVANAVFDGTDCVMLSGETAKGQWPREAVAIMADICRESEEASISFSRAPVLGPNPGASIVESIAAAAVHAAHDISASLIIVLTQSGTTAQYVAKFRPSVPVLTVTPDEGVAAQMLILRACFPLLVGSMVGTDSLVHRIIHTARALKMCKTGDNVIITRGATENQQGGTNSLKICKV